MIETLTLLILLIPFGVFLFHSSLLLTLGPDKRELSGYINSLFIGLCFLFSIIVIFNIEDFSSTISFSWISIGNVDLNFSLMLDPLTAIMLVVVSGISFLVQIYSIGYMHDDKSFSKYFAYMALFTGSMLGLVVSRNILQLFIFTPLSIVHDLPMTVLPSIITFCPR